MNKVLTATLSLLASAFLSSAAIADENAITATKVAGQVYALQGAPGGNIGVLATEKGLLLVDDKYGKYAQDIEKAMKSIIDKPLKYVVNTHYHGDHTGSNSYFSHHAPIFAHENVRNRLAKNEKLTEDALPVVTYDKGVKIFLENEEVQLTHLPSGHTDSDTIVYFKQANTLHTGDLFFEVGFPYVDLNGGGSVKGYLDNVNYMLQNYPDDVKIIPGHGVITDKDGLQAFATMISDCIELVKTSLAKGMSEQDILAQGVAEKYKGLSWSFINEEKWLKTLVKDLK